jgi:hypothetical protein
MEGKMRALREYKTTRAEDLGHYFGVGDRLDFRSKKCKEKTEFQKFRIYAEDPVEPSLIRWQDIGVPLP